MSNRKRDKRIVFRVSEEEYNGITKKMEQTGIINRESYLRKMALDGYILKLDMSALNELIRLLSNATNNLNQIAKRVNETYRIYKDDIEELKKNYEMMWESTRKVLKLFSDVF